MARLNIERQAALEPKRMLYAKHQIEAKGYTVSIVGNTRLEFEYKGNKIQFYPYSGWAAGKGIEDGRGLQKLLDQI